jgi:hypothetical protein
MAQNEDNEMETIAPIKKELLQKIMDVAYNGKPFENSKDLLNALKDKLGHDIAQKLDFKSDEDQYGTLKLSLKDDNLPKGSIIRIKTSNTYDGPKTENYLDKGESFIAAAKAMAKENPKEVDILKKIDEAYNKFKEKINQQAKINPKEMGDLQRDNKNANAHFNEKHNAAKFLLEQLKRDLYSANKDKNLPERDPLNKEEQKELKAFGKALYDQEAQNHIGPRPELITLHQNSVNNKKCIHVDIATPVDPESTGSSAFKQKEGIANHLKSTSLIYNSQGKDLLAENTNFRSASLTPHELFATDPKTAQKYTNHNIENILIPQLLEEALKNPDNKSKNPIELNYVLQTLLSPLAFEQRSNPDKSQVRAVRDALNRYSNREISVTGKDNQQYTVKLNATYVNYGCNFIRGWGGKREAELNAKGFNQLYTTTIDKLTQHLEKQKEENPKNQENQKNEELLKIFNDAPKPSKDEQTLLTEGQEILTKLYRQPKNDSVHLATQGKDNLIENLDKLPTKNRNKIIKIYELNQRTNSSFNNKKSFDYSNTDMMARAIEREIRHTHKNIYDKRSNHFKKNSKTIDDLLKEQDPKSEFAQHVTAFNEYAKLSRKPYGGFGAGLARIANFAISQVKPSFLITKKVNSRNYAIQKYVHQICQYNDVPYHKTCKSGKDRTGYQALTENAINTFKTLEGRLPKFNDPKDTKALQTLVDQNFLHGSGRYICGHNMPPGAFQIDGIDVVSPLNIANFKDIAQLQRAATQSPKNHINPDLQNTPSTPSPNQSTGKATSLSNKIVSLIKQLVKGINDPSPQTSQSQPQSNPNQPQAEKPAAPPKTSALFTNNNTTPPPNNNAPRQRSGTLTPALGLHQTRQTTSSAAPNLKQIQQKLQQEQYSSTINETEQCLNVTLKSTDRLTITAHDNGLAYTLPQDKLNNENDSIIEACQLAVTLAEPNTTFDLSQTDDSIKETVHQALKEAIGPNNQQNLKISGVKAPEPEPKSARHHSI